MVVRTLGGILVAAVALAGAACVGALPGDNGTGAAGSGDTAGTTGSGGAGAPGGGGAAGKATVPGTAGAGGSAVAASGGAGIVGAAGSSGGMPGGDSHTPRLVIFYTRWGTSYPEWWPTGTETTFALGSVLSPLERYKDRLIILSGLTNANVYADATLRPAAATDGSPDAAMATLLTALPAASDGSVSGASFDTAVGTCGGSTGPPLRLAVGQFGYDDDPGVSFDAVGVPLRGERDPVVAARSVGVPVRPIDLTASIDSNYPMIGQAHIEVAAEALAAGKTCAVTLMWGDDFVPTFLGLTQRVHELSHTTSDLYAAVQQSGGTVVPTPFGKLQNFYAQMFLALLDQMSNTPVGAGTLLDQSVVVWISETGQGSDHLGRYIPVVIAGSGGGRLDVGRYIQVKPHAPAAGTFIDIDSVVRTQGDLFAALGRLWGVGGFGDPRITRQPLTEILKN
jgi:hypothetical protein